MYYNFGMELKEKANFLETKYSLDNLKKQKISILTNPTTFTGFDRIGSGKDIIIKEYYDTPDFFLQDRGVTINVNTVKGKKTSELVVRWDTGRERIRFLSNIPDTFTREIPLNSKLSSYADFIADSISELVPNGLNVDIVAMVKTLVKVFTVRKKREFYKFINITGFKHTMSFSDVEFVSNISRKKESVLMLEIISDSPNKQMEYDAFTKKLSFNNPTIIKLKNSDMLLGRDYLFPKKTDKPENQ